MKTHVERLTFAYERLQATIAGRYLHRALLGFAEILDNSENVHDIDPDLVDMYMIIGLKNGTTIQITGQLIDVGLIGEKNSRYANTVKLCVEDRKTGVMPTSTFIFSLDDVYSIQSLDVVAHQRKLAERYAAEEDKNALVESPVTTAPVKKEKTKDGEEV